MNLNRMRLISLLILALCTAIPAHAGEVVAEFSGSRSMQTAEFEVEGPWILDWRVTGDYARDMAIDVTLIEARTLRHIGNVLKVKWAGNGVRMFDESGRFFFRVDSTLTDWTLKVEQLTREEAELYTPKDQNKLDY